ncbi:MAG: ParB/RepB/Spo0J family partition protein [Actinomycetota bacterium]
MGQELDALLGLGSSGAPEGASPDGVKAGGGAHDVGRPVDGARPAERRHADLLWLHPAAIRPNQFQPREHFDDAELDALAGSIAELGVLQPLLVRRVEDHLYELIAGERRWRAAQRAGVTEIPVLVRDTDDRTSLEEAVVENLHRQDLTPIEEAAAYRQLLEEFGLTQDEVAKRVGKSRSAVANTLRLLHLVPEVQRLVTVGQLSAGHARALLAVLDGRAQMELAGRVIADELSVRQTEELVRRGGKVTVRGGTDGSSARGLGDVALREIEAQLGERLATNVRATLSQGRGRLVIEFADLEDLDRIYRELS